MENSNEFLRTICAENTVNWIMVQKTPPFVVFLLFFFVPSFIPESTILTPRHEKYAATTTIDSNAPRASTEANEQPDGTWTPEQ